MDSACLQLEKPLWAFLLFADFQPIVLILFVKIKLFAGI